MDVNSGIEFFVEEGLGFVVPEECEDKWEALDMDEDPFLFFEAVTDHFMTSSEDIDMVDAIKKMPEFLGVTEDVCYLLMHKQAVHWGFTDWNDYTERQKERYEEKEIKAMTKVGARLKELGHFS
jgi:hypothetical protein